MRSHLRPAVLGPAIITVALFAMLAAPASVAAADAPITFDMTIYGNCVSGWTGGGDVDVVWRDHGGVLKAQGTVTDRWSTWFKFCPGDATLTVLPGDRINVSTEFATRKYVVPNLTVHLDRVNDRALGTGPAGRTIRLCSGWSWLRFSAECHSVRVGQDGQWTYNPHTNIYGGMEVEIYWRSPKGDRLFEAVNAPQLGVTIGKPGFSGWTDPLRGVDVSLTGSDTGGGLATGAASGAYSGMLRDPINHPVSVEVGDHITAPSLASDADWIVPTISASANRQTEVVTGNCSNTPDARLEIWVIRPGGHVRGIGIWFTDENANFEADFTEYQGGGDVSQSLNIKSGDKVRIDCFQPTGDYTRWSFMVP